MFTYLKVKNFALMDDVEIEFKRGFTAFVGETGAGKSLLVDAINLLSGARSAVSFVKQGTNWALIQGSFFLHAEHQIFSRLAAHDIVIGQDEELIVERKIMHDGRTTCKIQGVKVPTSFLKTIMYELIDIHGQHETSTLLDTKTHLALLDTFGSYDVLLAEYQTHYRQGIALQEEKQQLKGLYEQIELIPEYEKQIDELVQADVSPDELAEIDERLTSLRTFNKQFSTMQEITTRFDEGKLIDQLYEIKGLYEKNGLDRAAHARVASAYYDLQDIRDEVAGQVAAASEQKQEQEKLEARIAEIFTLQKKYGDDLQQARTTLAGKIDKLQNIEFEYMQIGKRLAEQKERILGLGKRLHAARKETATALEQAIMQQLADLQMAVVEFNVRFKTQEATATGFDAVEFYVKTNVGTEFQPLARIASGGELSRIMLAIKIVFAHNQTLSTIIFDEIDTGVSGGVAEAIAKKLRLFSANQQVFAITHLPQVLAASNHQLLLEKDIVDETTHIHVRYLSSVEHELEVAKMLSGTAITDVGKQHAANLRTSFEKI
jgi:DNA repair protein RecN (Recombination protein N)